MYRLPADEWPEDGDSIGRYAGRPGGFSRQTALVRKWCLTSRFDVALDNRLTPQKSWETRIPGFVWDPVVHARLWYRPYVPG